MTDQTLQITYGDGSTQTVDVTVQATHNPPGQGKFSQHVVKIGNGSKAQAVLTLTPGLVVAPVPPPPEVPSVTITDVPSGASGEIDWTTTGTLSDTQVVLDGTSHEAKGNSFQYSGLAAGSHAATVVVTDVDGKTATSTPVSWTVVPVPPPPPPSGIPSSPTAPVKAGAVSWTADFSQGSLPAGWLDGTGWFGSKAAFTAFLSASDPNAHGRACVNCYVDPAGSGAQGLVTCGSFWGGAEHFVAPGQYVEALVYFTGASSDDGSAYNWPAWWITALGGNWPGQGEMDIVEQYGAGLSANYHGGGGASNGPVHGNYCNTWFVAGCLRMPGTNYIYWGPPSGPLALIRTISTSDGGGNEYPVFSSGVGGGPTKTGIEYGECCAYIRCWDNCTP